MTDTQDLLQKFLADRAAGDDAPKPVSTPFRTPAPADDSAAAAFPLVAAHIAFQTGRGPTGRLRNFRAMSDTKFYDVAATIRSENNDPEAIEAINAEQEARES